jgi:hypothetical protein
MYTRREKAMITMAEDRIRLAKASIEGRSRDISTTFSSLGRLVNWETGKLGSG